MGPSAARTVAQDCSEKAMPQDLQRSWSLIQEEAESLSSSVPAGSKSCSLSAVVFFLFLVAKEVWPFCLWGGL